MKKICLMAIVLLSVSTLSAGAQGMEDALRYSQQFYVGSARTMAMGNAFTALGGDLGAVSINPASTALYNCCEFAITGGLQWDRNSASFATTEGNYFQKTGRTVFTVPNISMVFSMPTGRETGLVGYTFGFGFNKIANFNTRVGFRGEDSDSSLLGNIAANLEGLDNSYLTSKNAFYDGYANNQEILAYDTYLVNPYHGTPDSYIGATENEWASGGLGVDCILDKTYDRIRKGGIYDMSFNFGLNFSDRLYLGANINVNLVDFTDDLLYTEDGAVAGNFFDSGFKAMKYNYYQETSGAGVNLQLGAIWVPLDFLRLGASYTTPTIYNLTDRWSEYMASGFDGTTMYKSAESESPVLSCEYRVKAPSRLSLGAAVVFGRSGLVSFDYERVNYGKVRMADNNSGFSDSFNSFKDANDDIATLCGKTNIFRVGAEWNTLKWLALRGGFTSHVFNNPQYQFVSCGLGMRVSERSSLDLAFRTRLKDTYDMTPYDDYGFNDAGVAQCLAPVATISNRAYDLLLTYRVKF
ncbi:MAG: hypothetical protein IJS30_01275 [Bacteroidales bacterium]|nr:hypothetical protein [Bacteroidales bacterium]